MYGRSSKHPVVIQYCTSKPARSSESEIMNKSGTVTGLLSSQLCQSSTLQFVHIYASDGIPCNKYPVSKYRQTPDICSYGLAFLIVGLRYETVNDIYSFFLVIQISTASKSTLRLLATRGTSDWLSRRATREIHRLRRFLLNAASVVEEVTSSESSTEQADTGEQANTWWAPIASRFSGQSVRKSNIHQDIDTKKLLNGMRCISCPKGSSCQLMSSIVQLATRTHAVLQNGV